MQIVCYYGLVRTPVLYWQPPLPLCREYHRNNVSVNLFVINAPWLFSVLWCAGTTSVTTNACQVLQKMKHPLWLLVRPLGVSGGATAVSAEAPSESLGGKGFASQQPTLICRPSSSQPRATYQMIWIVTDCVSLLLVLSAFLLLK